MAHRRDVCLDAWTAEHHDLVEPADIEFDGKGSGKIVFGALRATMECGAAADAADFDWRGFDEGDEVNGDGFVQLQPDGSLEAEFAYDKGDDSTLQARRGDSSTPC